MQLALARHPADLASQHPLIIDQLLILETQGKQRGVSMILRMLWDLHTQGRESQYLVKLKSSPVWELKPTSRGGEAGGARVYLFLMHRDRAAIVSCELKEGNAPNVERIREVLIVIAAYTRGVPVFEKPRL